jgi:hypothetical protein
VRIEEFLSGMKSLNLMFVFLNKSSVCWVDTLLKREATFDKRKILKVGNYQGPISNGKQSAYY